MKKVFFCFFLALIMVGYGFSQNNLTQDQIRRHANELGVPYEALQRLVDSHRAQTGLTNPNASGAQLLTLHEINFMRESGTLEVGSFYRIRAQFFYQNGRRVNFETSNPSYATLGMDASFLVNVAAGTTLDALIGVRANKRGNPELFLVEIAVAR